MVIRRFLEEDAEDTAQVIAETIKICNSRDYPAENIETNINSHSSDLLKERAKLAHMYVVCDHEKIIGCGAIAGYWGSKTESILLTVFVLPEYQNKGIGRKIIETLEEDEFFKRAHRVEIPASITACEFYKKMGYTYKNSIDTPGVDGCIRLEKYR